MANTPKSMEMFKSLAPTLLQHFQCKQNSMRIKRCSLVDDLSVLPCMWKFNLPATNKNVNCQMEISFCRYPFSRLLLSYNWTVIVIVTIVINRCHCYNCYCDLSTLLSLSGWFEVFSFWFSWFSTCSCAQNNKLHRWFRKFTALIMAAKRASSAAGSADPGPKQQKLFQGQKTVKVEGADGAGKA